ncbi:MAG TPA: UDP-glucose 4-epimerase GalE [Parafilimonas sp.]|nr:UDP-glucose 4-epimerase GalE [Parafilimonas sp.]
MAKKKILVTGGLGFIGSHTVVELINAGYDVVIADDLSNSQFFVLDRIEEIAAVKPSFYKIDVSDKEKLCTLFESAGDIDAVIHFAAFKAVGESVHEPIKYFHNNLFSLVTLLECMEQFNIKNMVFSSSATVYGDPDVLPVTESTAFKKALSSYGSTKQIGEEILEKTTAAKNIAAIALRYFNPVGAHNSALIGELPIGVPNNLMPFIAQTAAGIREQLVVFGNDYDTPDGTCIRDYIHVVDLAKAHVKSCDRLISESVENKYEVFNVGTGNGISVMDVITAFEKYNELKINYTIGKRRAGDAAAVYADVSKANNVLGWKAQLGLKEMVTSAWKWQQSLA